jgi:predicted Rossmann fold flavoprotein
VPRLIVIGGGAAGFFGAIRAKSLNPELEVLILESAPKALGKVKISGGGRCNVTHACFESQQLVQSYPRGQRELKSLLTRFGPADTMHWFESQGIRLKVEVDGRVFPVSDESQTIINGLLNATQEQNIQLLTKVPVKTISRSNTGYRIEAAQQAWEADAVLLTTGSASIGYQWVTQLGHTLVSPVPSLFSFKIQDALLNDMTGISFPWVQAKLELPGMKPIHQKGPLLITHWGLSGPAILKLSAWGARVLYEANYCGTLRVDFLPEYSHDQLTQQLLAQKAQTAQKHVGNQCPVSFAKRFWQNMLIANDIPTERPWGELSGKTIHRLVEAIKQSSFEITGKGPFKEEFVTAGGVSLKEVDFKTMESRCSPNLYLAGEILDIDGLTGGFNFQNAWSTGWIAGEAIAHNFIHL